MKLLKFIALKKHPMIQLLTYLNCDMVAKFLKSFLLIFSATSLCDKSDDITIM